MDDKYIVDLSTAVARLEEQMAFSQKADENLDEKVDIILAQITNSNAEREADIISLKVSLKNKINNSFKDLQAYHDDDLEEVKCVAKKTKWAGWVYDHPYITMFIGLAFLLSVGEQLIWLWEYKSNLGYIFDKLK